MSAVVARRYYLRGLELLDRGELADARAELRAAVELSPSFIEARVEYASLLARTDLSMAIQVTRGGLVGVARPARRRPLLGLLGDLLLAQGDWPGAEAAFAEDEVLAPGDPRHHDRRARLLAKAGRYAESFAALGRAAAGG